MNSDSHNNTLFVGTTVNGSVFALAAETLKTKWEYIVDDCVDPTQCYFGQSVFVEPELVPQCPGGAGAVSLIVCKTVCSVRIVDFNTGVLCSNITVPGSYRHSEFFLEIQAFPAGGALKKPMFVLVHQGYYGFGVDASTGDVAYTFNMGSNKSLEFEGFVAGSSPNNALFGYCIMVDGMVHFNTTAFVFRNIADGSLVLHRPWDGDVVTMMDVSQLAWAASTESSFGGMAFPSLSVSGKTCVAFLSLLCRSWVTLEMTNWWSSYTRLANVGNQWTMGLDLTAARNSLHIFGFPVAPTPAGATQFTATLPPVPTFDVMDGVLASFQYVDGTSGVASIVYGSSKHQTHTASYLTVFRL